MTPRNTRTGGVLEQMVVPALDQGGYAYKVQVNIGQRLGCGQHFVDVIAEKDRHRILISMKWQQVLEALESGDYAKAYLVLGGEGWTLRNFYTGDGLQKYLNYGEKVEILTLESFVGRANAGKL